jgi:hypothetical protein
MARGKVAKRSQFRGDRDEVRTSIKKQKGQNPNEAVLPYRLMVARRESGDLAVPSEMQISAPRFDDGSRCGPFRGAILRAAGDWDRVTKRVRRAYLLP